MQNTIFNRYTLISPQPTLFTYMIARLNAHLIVLISTHICTRNRAYLHAHLYTQSCLFARTTPRIYKHDCTHIYTGKLYHIPHSFTNLPGTSHWILFYLSSKTLLIQYIHEEWCIFYQKTRIYALNERK